MAGLKISGNHRVLLLYSCIVIVEEIFFNLGLLGAAKISFHSVKEVTRSLGSKLTRQIGSNIYCEEIKTNKGVEDPVHRSKPLSLKF